MSDPAIDSLLIDLAVTIICLKTQAQAICLTQQQCVDAELGSHGSFAPPAALSLIFLVHCTLTYN